MLNLVGLDITLIIMISVVYLSSELQSIHLPRNEQLLSMQCTTTALAIRIV